MGRFIKPFPENLANYPLVLPASQFQTSNNIRVLQSFSPPASHRPSEITLGRHEAHNAASQFSSISSPTLQSSPLSVQTAPAPLIHFEKTEEAEAAVHYAEVPAVPGPGLRLDPHELLAPAVHTESQLHPAVHTRSELHPVVHTESERGPGPGLHIEPHPAPEFKSFVNLG